jgi:glycosyltransferase involved in cell wall biosynthesis
VVSSHGETFADAHDSFAESAILPRALRAAAGRAGAVTGCSSLVVDHLATHFGARGAVVVPNGVDLDVAVPPSSTLAPTNRHKVVLGVGRLEHNKGFDLLLQAVAALDSSGPPVRVRLVGDGTQRDRLAALARSLGIADRVDFTGALDAAAVAREMAGATVVVVPSRTESFGIVVLEAWRAGTPVVATSLGGPAGFVHDGVDGLIVDPTHEAALAAAISRVVTDHGLARDMAEAGLSAVRGYTWQATAEAYATIYDRVLSQPEA